MTRTLATVLFADVVSSTEHVRALGDEAWAKTLESFHRAAARAVSASGGRRVKDTGDGLLVSFSSPALALRCAHALLDQAEASGLELRIGIHTGECELTAGGDLRGTAVHLAARVMSAAGPGEVLVSVTVKDLLAGTEASFADRGEQPLKGFDEPVRLFLAAGAPSEPRPPSPPSTVALRLTSGPRLVGRSEEVEFLSSALGEAAEGALVALAVEGEAGIGKSRLLGEAVRLATERGFVTLVGGADELETDIPFRALRGALGLDTPSGVDADRAELVALLGTKWQRAPNEGVTDLGGVVVDTTLDVLERLALASPVLLAVDDLQWADPLTLRVLRAICRRLVGLPVALICGFRPVPRPPELDLFLEAATAHAGRVIRLGPLADDVVAELAAEVTGATPGPRLRSRLAGAGGNPLFVGELLRALRQDGALAVVEGMAESDSAEVPTDLRMTLLRRLAGLPASTVEVLRTASVLGSAFSVADLAAVRKCSLSEVVNVLDPAVRAGFVGDAGDRMAFRHDLIREAVYEDFPSPMRKALHLEAAEVLAQAGRPLPHVAEHYLLGAEPGDEVAAATVRAAAEVAVCTSPAIALRLLERAFDLSPPGSALRDELVADLLELLPGFGRAADAERLAAEVLARETDPQVAGRVHFGLAAVIGHRGDLLGAAQQMRLGAAVEGIGPDLRDRFLVIANDIEGVFDPPKSEAYARSALEQVAKTGDRVAECTAYQTLTMAALARGAADEAVEYGLAGVALRERGDFPELSYLLPYVWGGLALFDLDRTPDAIDIWRRGVRDAEDSGFATDFPVHQVCLGGSLYLTGRWEEAEAELDAAIAHMEELDIANVGIATFSFAARLALHRGEKGRAQELADSAQRLMDRFGLQVSFDWLFWVQALLLEQDGDPGAALSLLGTGWDLTPHVRYLLTWRISAPELVRLATACGDADRAESVTAETEEGARRNPVASSRGTALLCRGMADGDTDALVAAVGAYRDSPRVPDLARAAEIAGKALLKTHRADGEALLAEAFSIWDGLGATGDVARVGELLGKKKPERRKARATFGWEALTPAELEVAKLVVEGLTNREAGGRLFVSRRTVETHLSHIFTKLGVSSRAQVAAVAARELAGVGE